MEPSARLPVLSPLQGRGSALAGTRTDTEAGHPKGSPQAQQPRAHPGGDLGKILFLLRPLSSISWKLVSPGPTRSDCVGSLARVGGGRPGVTFRTHYRFSLKVSVAQGKLHRGPSS